MKLNVMVVNVKPRLVRASKETPARVVHRVTLDYYHDDHKLALDEFMEMMGDPAVMDIKAQQTRMKLDKGDVAD